MKSGKAARRVELARQLAGEAASRGTGMLQKSGGVASLMHKNHLSERICVLLRCYSDNTALSFVDCFFIFPHVSSGNS